jgi:hypothetical protein
MADQSAQAKPAINTIQAFAREIAQMSEQALVRATGHVEKLRKAHRMEEAASIQADYLKESMEPRGTTQDSTSKCWRPSRTSWCDT